MGNYFSAIQIIAEQRICEAMENGDLDNLPGMGKPLPEDDLSNVPEDLRMAYHILKNAGCIPNEVAERKEINSLSDLLDHCQDEKERIGAMRRLRFLLDHMDGQRHVAIEARDEYYQKVLAKLERHERACPK